MRVIRIAFVIAFFSLSVSAAHAGEAVGWISEADGKALLVRADGSDPLELRRFLRVYEGDRLVTRRNGRTKVVMMDRSSFSLGPDTVMVIARVDPTKSRRNTLLSLLKGKVRAIVARIQGDRASNYHIATPTAVAGVRGTIATMGAGEGAGEYCIMEEGSVEWCQGSNCITVPEHQVAFVNPKGVWEKPRPMTDDDLEELSAPAFVGDSLPPVKAPGARDAFAGDPHPLDWQL